MASTPETTPSGSASIPETSPSPDGIPDEVKLRINGDQHLQIRKNKPAETGFDPETSKWINHFNALTGRMSNEGVFHFREHLSRTNQESDIKRSEDYRDWLFRHSPIVRYMRDQIRKLGGDLTPDNVVCRRCPSKLTADGRILNQGGGFSPQHGILVCANAIRDRKHMEDTLAHEMVHAYDHLRWQVDFIGEKDLRHAACTEIRASMLSGECRFTREAFTRGNWTVTQQFQNCVRSRAIMSVRARARCRDTEHATKVVNQVWDSCFADTRPFDEIYK